MALKNAEYQEQLKKEQQEGLKKYANSVIKLTIEKHTIQIEKLKDKIKYLSYEESRIAKKAKKDVYWRVIPAYMLSGIVISFLCFYLYSNYIKPYWSAIEPALLFSGVLVSYCLVGYKMFLGKDFSPKAFLAKLVERRLYSLYEIYNFNCEEIGGVNETYNYLTEESKLLYKIQNIVLSSTKGINEIFEELSTQEGNAPVNSLLNSILSEIEPNTVYDYNRN
jgi:hypothetical protein